MSKVLIIQLRADDAAADGEYDAFLKFGQLSKKDVHRVRLEQGSPNININDYSAVIIGGGPWNVSDSERKKTSAQKEGEQFMKELLHQIYLEDKPYLGACYGFGILIEQQKGQMSQDTYSEDLGEVTIHLKDAAKTDPLLKDIPQVFAAFAGHKESCEALPKGAVWLASSDGCPYQMFRLKNNIYATQFHPELDAKGTLARIDAYKFNGYFPPEDAEKLKEKFSKINVKIPMIMLKNFCDLYCR